MDEYVSVPQALREIDDALEARMIEGAVPSNLIMLNHDGPHDGIVHQDSVVLMWRLLRGCKEPRVQALLGLHALPREWLEPKWHEGDDREQFIFRSPVGQHLDISAGIIGSGHGGNMPEAQLLATYGSLRGMTFVRRSDLSPFTKPAGRRQAGRPRKQLVVVEVYRQLFPNGHGDLPDTEVFRRVNRAAEVPLSNDTMRRALRTLLRERSM